MHGVTIHGNPRWATDKTAEIAPRYAYTLYRSLANNYWRYKDICGALEIGRGVMACDLACMFLMDETRASLHLNGLVNPTRKWISVFWQQMAPTLYPDVHDEVLQLLFCADIRRPYDYVGRVFSAVEALERVNCQIMDANPNFPSAARQLELLEKERSTRAGFNSQVQVHELLFRRRSFESSGPSYVDLLTYL